MLRENGVTCQVSDIHLDKIARSYCRKWRSLSSHLEVPIASIVVDDIDKCQASKEEKRRSFFGRREKVLVLLTGERSPGDCLSTRCRECMQTIKGFVICVLLDEWQGTRSFN